MLRTRDSATRAGDIVGGYPLLRKLGEGERAEVFLATAVVGAGDDGVAVKVYRPSVSFASIDAELECLSRAEHAHVVHVRDVSSTCLVLERLELGSLAHLLVARRSIALGEALTILAPLGAALDAVHASGVVHSAVRASSVMFRASGAPALACFGRASSTEPDRTIAALAADPGVVADREAFAHLARSVLERVPFDRRVRAIDQWLDEQSRSGFPDPIGDELADRLFDITEPQPVRFEPDSEASVPSIPSRAIAPGGAARADVAPADVAPADVVARHEPSVVRGLGLPPWLGEALESSPLTVLRSHLTGVRRPVWIALVAVGLALGAAILLVPDNQPAAVPQRPAPSSSAGPVTEVHTDDPLDAVPLLLATREGCIRELSPLCLEAVDQVGSAAMSADTELIESIVGGTEPPMDAVFASTEVTLTERLGDSALISLGKVPQTQPASLLLMKGEAGWRIRGYLMGD